jgi:N-acetylglucosamine malate deacetylase 1
MSDEQLDIVAVGAHPDDCEITVGGILAKAVRQGYRVGIVDLTDGEPTPNSPGPEVRLAESRKAAEILGVHFRQTLELTNRRLMDSFEARCMLATILRRHRAKVVLGFAGATPMASPDHQQAQMITEAAVFYSRLTKWNEHFEGTEPHTVTSYMTFPTLRRAIEIGHAAGNFTVDIGDTLETKLDAIRAYETQFPPDDPSRQAIFKRIESLNRAEGNHAGFDAGEVLMTVRPIGVTDLMTVACPSDVRTWRPVQTS